MPLKRNERSFRVAGTILAVLVLTALPAVAEVQVIKNGIDVWTTSEVSYSEFLDDPIPAGFFCSGSEPFTGRIHWRGLPVATNPPDALGTGDTIFHRLDDAAFNRNGVATTRLQVKAISLASIEPVETACGAFDATAMLAPGDQPTTRMRIVRQGEDRGFFEAPLVLNTLVTFTPVGGGRSLEFEQVIEFPATRIFWATERPLREEAPTQGLTRAHMPLPLPSGFVLLDTDGDRSPDTFVPGRSNFFPTGQARNKIAICDDPNNPGASCHIITGSDCHCVYP